MPPCPDLQPIPHDLRIERYAANRAGRDLIVGDIHGAFSRLRKALRQVRFDDRADRLFCVGDLVDRGPESQEAIEWLSKGRIHSVLGNHERAGLDFVCGDLEEDVYASNGGEWNIRVPLEVRRRRAELFARMPVAIELETPAGVVGLVHADVPTQSWNTFRQELRFENCKQADERHLLDAALNSRRRFRRGVGGLVEGVHAVVVGHSRVGKPVWSSNVLCIETGGWSDGFFTILDAATLVALPGTT